MARAQIEVWWVSGDGVGGPWWVEITGTSDKDAGALRSFNRAKCPTFLLNSADNLLHLRNTGSRLRASPTFDDPALFLQFYVHKMTRCTTR